VYQHIKTSGQPSADMIWSRTPVCVYSPTAPRNPNPHFYSERQA